MKRSELEVERLYYETDTGVFFYVHPEAGVIWLDRDNAISIFGDSPTGIPIKRLQG